MKDHLIFDTTDAGTIVDTDSVGAHIRAGKGGALVSYHGDIQANSTVDAFVPGDVTAASDQIALTGHGFNNGDKVRFTTDTTLPNPLVAATDYWVIYVDANTIKVAASQADAELGIAIDITDGGVGNHTITAQPYDIRALDVHVVNSVVVTATDLDIRDLSAAQDSIESWTHDGTGNAITSTGGALDINIASSDIQIDVDLNGVYDVGINPDPDNVGMIAHSRAAAPDDTDQVFRSTGGAASADDVVAANVHGLDVNAFGMVFDGTTWDRLRGTAGAVNINDGGNSITVDAVDLDIRDLTQADEITVFQGTDPWIIGDGGGSITVDAADLDIRDLTHVSDSVRLGDGTNFLTSTTVGADVGLDVFSINDPSVANTAIASAVNTLAVANTAENVVASPLANRKILWVYNNDNKKIYIGQSGVSAANGFPISPGSYVEMRAGAAVDIEWVSDKTNHDIRTLELS